MCVCVCVCVCVYINVYIYIYECIYVYVYIVPFLNTHKKLALQICSFFQLVFVQSDTDYQCIYFQVIFFFTVSEKSKGKITPNVLALRSFPYNQALINKMSFIC